MTTSRKISISCCSTMSITSSYAVKTSKSDAKVKKWNSSRSPVVNTAD
ncbi:unnamed protein product [Amoebophrya sp. A25]|nr:unnamed protein product [Amoebophrya sp. A25]|eukprot:GSA25T00012068001.1